MFFFFLTLLFKKRLHVSPLQYRNGIFLHYIYQDLHVMFTLEDHGQLENE